MKPEDLLNYSELFYLQISRTTSKNGNGVYRYKFFTIKHNKTNQHPKHDINNVTRIVAGLLKCRIDKQDNMIWRNYPNQLKAVLRDMFTAMVTYEVNQY